MGPTIAVRVMFVRARPYRRVRLPEPAQPTIIRINAVYKADFRHTDRRAGTLSEWETILELELMAARYDADALASTDPRLRYAVWNSRTSSSSTE